MDGKGPDGVRLVRSEVEWIFPLQLTGGAFTVYLQLCQGDKTDAT